MLNTCLQWDPEAEVNSKADDEMMFQLVSAITSGRLTDTEIYYQWGAHRYEILLPVEEQF